MWFSGHTPSVVAAELCNYDMLCFVRPNRLYWIPNFAVNTSISGAFSGFGLFCLSLAGFSGNNVPMPYGETGERPWGSYLVLDDEPGHKVKRISVDEGKRLSYQYHDYRSEHWFITAGQARVILDGVEHDLCSGDAIDVPRRAKHRIENPGPGQLVFVEVQYGEYFGEDDIIRLDDDFGRADVRVDYTEA